MAKRPKKRKSAARKFFSGLLVALALVALFLISFFVTKLVLNINQNPGSYKGAEYEEATATPKPTYEELEKIVKEKDKEIEKLKDELTRYKGNAVQPTIAPSATQSTSKPKATSAPAEKPKATSAPAAAPATKAPAPATTAPSTVTQAPAA